MISTLYYGGPILTMVSPTPVQALLVREGIIQAVGSLEDLKALAPNAYGIDLQGCTLIPAFIDSHSYLSALAQSFALVPLAEARSFEEMHRLLKNFARDIQAKPDEWIIGFGYDHTCLPEYRHPTRQMLDQWFPANPVLLSHRNDHMGVANSRALQAMGFTLHSSDPSGGLLGRDTATGELNGYLEETAFTIHARRAVPRPSQRQQLRQLKMAEQLCLSHGITTIRDGGIQIPQWELLLEASQEAVFQADIIAYADFKKCPRLLREYPIHAEHYDNHLRLGGYEIFLDSRSCYEDQQVTDIFLTAYRENLQLLVHCSGNDASAQMIQACQEAMGQRNRQRLPIPDIRPVMLHAQLTSPDQISAMAACSIITSFIRHPDHSVLPADMLETLWEAAGCTFPEDGASNFTPCFSALEGLKAVTRTAAYQYHEENQKGSLSPGMLADLVILSDNPLTCSLENLRQIQILATIKEGRPVYQKDEHALLPT